MPVVEKGRIPGSGWSKPSLSLEAGWWELGFRAGQPVGHWLSQERQQEAELRGKEESGPSISLPGFRPYLCLAGRPWASYVTFLHFSFLTCKMGL